MSIRTMIHDVWGVAPLLLLAIVFVGCEHVDANDGEGLICNVPFEAGNFPASTISFARDVVPILSNNGCSSQFCHGAPSPPSNYSLLSAESALGPGNEAIQLGKCNITRGDPDNSYIVDKLTGAAGIIGERMPFGGTPITDAELDIVRQWITEGAPDN